MVQYHDIHDLGHTGATSRHFSPLGREDAVEDGALPAVPDGLEDKHVLDDVEGEAVVRQRAQQLRFQEGGPFLLQHALASFIALETQNAARQLPVWLEW